MLWGNSNMPKFKKKAKNHYVLNGHGDFLLMIIEVHRSLNVTNRIEKNLISYKLIGQF